MSVALIKSLQLENVILFGNKEIHLKAPLTIITGRNGTGKTLLLDCLRLSLGLKGKTLRLGKGSEFIFPGAKEARFTITLRNPISDVGGTRVISSEHPLFDSEYLNQDEVVIQRRVKRSGNWQVLLKAKNGEWKNLDSSSQDLLQKALKKAGLDPRDKLAFVDGEDFNVFISSNPNERFKAFLSKLQLEDGIKIGEQIKEKLEKLKEEKDGLKQKVRDMEEAINALKVKEDRQRRIIKLKEEIKQIQINEEWRDVIETEQALKNLQNRKLKLEQQRTTIEEKMRQLTAEVEDIQEKLKTLKASYEEKEKAYNDEERKKGLVDQQIANLKQDIREHKAKKSELLGKIEEITKEIKRREQEKAKILDGSLDERIKQQRKEIQRLQKELEELEHEIERDKQLIGDSNEKIEEFSEMIGAKTQELNSLKGEKQQIVEVLIQQQLEKKKGRKTPYPREVLQFAHEIDHLIKEKRVFGPLASVVKLKEEWNKEWVIPASIALRNVLLTFVALDHQAFKEMERIRRSNPAYKNISIGLSKSKNKLPLITTLDSKKYRTLVTSVIAILDGPKEVLTFVYGQGGKVFLAHDSDHIPKKELDLLQQEGYKSVSVLTKSGERYSSNKWAILSKSLQRMTLAAHLPPLGTPLRGAKEPSRPDIDNHPEVMHLNLQIQEIERQITDMVAKRKEEQNFKSNKEEQLRNKEKNKGTLEYKIKALEKAIEEKDSSVLLSQIDQRIEQFRETQNRIQGQIEEVDRFINERIQALKQFEAEREEIIAELEKASKLLKPIANEYQETMVQLSKTQPLVETTQKELNQIIDQLDKIIQRIPKLEQQLKQQLDELWKKGLKKRPEKILDKREVLEQLAAKKQELKLLEDPDLEKRDLAKEIQERQKTWEEVSQQLKQREREIAKLELELKEWKEQWNNTATMHIEEVNRFFDSILRAANARGRMEVINLEHPSEGQLFLRVQYPNETERDVEEHSSGQKQLSLVAFVLALQVLSGSPITAIDEVDKGLDPFHQYQLFDVLPQMIHEAMQLRESLHMTSYHPQVILITPKFTPPRESDYDYDVLVLARQQ